MNDYPQTSTASWPRDSGATDTGPSTGGERQKYVPERIAAMGKALEHLNMRVEELEKGLNPVLRSPAPVDGDTDKEPRQQFPPLVDQLDRLTDAIYGAIDRLEHILDRLEV